MANKKHQNKAKKVKKQASEETKSGKSGKNPSVPRSSEMVLEAIASLQQKQGASLQAIKKYIATTYRIDTAKKSGHIKKYIKSAVENNQIIQTKGKGANGSFRLPTKAESPKIIKKKVPKKPPSKKQAPVKSSGVIKKGDARKMLAGKSKVTVDNTGGKLKMRKSVTHKNFKK